MVPLLIISNYFEQLFVIDHIFVPGQNRPPFEKRANLDMAKMRDRETKEMQKRRHKLQL